MKHVALFILIAGIVLGAMSAPTHALDSQFKLQQWIAPLECTRSSTVDGETTTVILTPQECDDLLNPPNQGGGGKPPVTPTPNAPDTGVFREPILSMIGLSIMITATGAVFYLFLTKRRLHLSNKSLSSILSSRVSSFWNRKE